MPGPRLRAVLQRSASAALLVGLLSLGVAAPALAADPTPEPGSGSSSGGSSGSDGNPSDYPEGSYLEYTGELRGSNFSGEGETQERDPQPMTIGLHCDGTECEWTGISSWAFGPEDVPAPTFSAGTATSSWSWEESGQACDQADDSNDYSHAGSATVTASATGLVYDFRTEPSGWRDCDDGGAILHWGSESSLEGVVSGGDVCVLGGADCVVVEEAEAPAPVAEGSASPASAPTRLSALPTPAETLSPLQIALAAGVALVLVILVALPTALLNSAVEKGADGAQGWWREVAGRSSAPDVLRRIGARARSLWARLTGSGKGLWAAAATVLAAAIVSAFIHPAFGVTAASWRMLLSIVVGFAVDIVLGWFVLVWIMRRLQPDAAPVFEARPATLLVVLGAVVFTRVSGFEPGIVFGLVAGVAFGTALATAARARVALITLGWGLVLALAAWIVYAAVAAAAAPADGGLVSFVQESLSAITIAGIAALPIALVPLRGLIGHDLWSWSRWAWAGAYAAGLLAFFLVLMPMPYAWGEATRGLWSWIGVFVLYAAVAAGVWLLVARPWRRPVEETAAETMESDEAPASA